MRLITELQRTASSDHSPATATPTHNDDDDEYPEGGLEAWVVVLGAWCAMVPPMGLINSINIFQAWFSENQLRGMPESDIGWIVSTFAFLVTALGAQVGE